MKVAKSDVLDFLPEPHVSTILFLDGNVPLTAWRKVKIDGVTYAPIFMSGFAEDQIALKGRHELDGLEVEFV